MQPLDGFPAAPAITDSPPATLIPLIPRHSSHMDSPQVQQLRRDQWEKIYKLVVSWANDMSWEEWWDFKTDYFGISDYDTEPDYEVVVRVVDGQRVPYLTVKGDGSRGCTLDNTTYMYTEPPWQGMSPRPESP